MGVIYENDLALAATHLRHSSLLKDAVVTYAYDQGTLGHTAQTIANTLQTYFTDNFKGVLDTAVSITKTTVLLGDGTDTFTTAESTSAPVAGTHGIVCAPPNCALLIKKTNGFGGRTNRGRMYLPFALAQDEIGEQGSASSTRVAAVQSAADDWMSGLFDSGSDSGLCIAQRTYDAAWDVPGRSLVSVAGSEKITNLLVESFIATQRRRMTR